MVKVKFVEFVLVYPYCYSLSLSLSLFYCVYLSFCPLSLSFCICRPSSQSDCLIHCLSLAFSYYFSLCDSSLFYFLSHSFYQCVTLPYVYLYLSIWLSGCVFYSLYLSLPSNLILFSHLSLCRRLYLCLDHSLRGVIIISVSFSHCLYPPSLCLHPIIS